LAVTCVRRCSDEAKFAERVLRLMAYRLGLQSVDVDVCGGCFEGEFDNCRIFAGTYYSDSKRVTLCPSATYHVAAHEFAHVLDDKVNPEVFKWIGKRIDARRRRKDLFGVVACHQIMERRAEKIKGVVEAFTGDLNPLVDKALRRWRECEVERS